MNGPGLAMVVFLAALAAPPASRAQIVPMTPDRSKAQERADNAKADREDGLGGCIYINQLQGDRPLNDRSVIFRANASDFYQLDFAQRCIELTYPQPVVILTPVGGIGSICHAIDLDVKVREQGPGSIAVPCIPSAFHKMTPAEVAAIPKKNLP